jgi:hypothetical protein
MRQKWIGDELWIALALAIFLLTLLAMTQGCAFQYQYMDDIFDKEDTFMITVLVPLELNADYFKQAEGEGVKRETLKRELRLHIQDELGGFSESELLTLLTNDYSMIRGEVTVLARKG